MICIWCHCLCSLNILPLLLSEPKSNNPHGPKRIKTQGHFLIGMMMVLAEKLRHYQVLTIHPEGGHVCLSVPYFMAVHPIVETFHSWWL